MTDYTDHQTVVELLATCQEDESDMREAAREAHLFINKKDGQWEPYWWNANTGRPRYTFDQVSPVVDIIAGELEEADFSIDVSPAGGDATKDDAKLLDGLIRNIQNISNAEDIYEMAGRRTITGGIDGWQVKHAYVDDDSFDQDLLIEPIANFLDSVFFLPFKKPDGSDSKGCFVLEAYTKADYKEKWPNGSGQSVSVNRLSSAYYHKPDQIIVAQFYYIKEEPRELLLMGSGMVLENSADNKMILDELIAAGDTVEKRRNRPKKVVYSRLLDATDWLNKPQRTVFNQVPVIPCMANFDVFENKVIYRGVVEKMMDPQRVYNYAKSREIEEGALAPRGKYWGTPKQTAGHETTLRTLNTNADPLQHYNVDPAAPPGPPVWVNGGSVNQGLQLTSESMSGILRNAGGMYAASMGDNPNAQSGVAIKSLQNKGDTGTIKYFSCVKRAIARTGRILVDAIPVVYDTPRQVRILKEDGSFDMQVVNNQVFDEQSGRWITINDLSKGKYDVVCSAGPSFQNRQQETIQAITEIGQVDPSVIEMGSDILFNNLNSPGMELLAERKRMQLFMSGMIPESQYTEEERQMADQQAQEAANNPPPEDPAMVLAQAEQGKAQAQQQKIMVDAQSSQREQDRKDFEVQMKQQNMMMETQSKQFEQFMKAQAARDAHIETMADTLKTLREAFGIDSAVSPTGLQALVNQSKLVVESQDS